ncbi:MAG: phage portal protein [Chloroflexi bacterium]|nr:phage portal protein [Chloroflexota bacterium]
MPKLLDFTTGDAARYLTSWGTALRRLPALAHQIHTRSRPADDDDSWYDDIVRASLAGIKVTPESALRCGAVYASVRVLAETVGSLPLHLYRRTVGGRKKATDLPLYHRLHLEPNPEMTTMQWRETSMGHLNLRGNSYNWLDWTAGHKLQQILPLPPARVTPERDPDTKKIVYFYRPEKEAPAVIPAEQMLHVRGLAPDGLKGYSPIELQREPIGLTLGAEAYGSTFFGNDARPGGILEHPGKLGKTGHDNIRESWQRQHGGITKKHLPAILEEGMSWKNVAIPQKDAQFIELRNFQVEEIARIFRLPPHKIGHLLRATFDNIEHQDIEFARDSIRPWCVRIEQQMNLTLLLPGEREELYFEHSLDGLLRGDTETRYKAYRMARQDGWMNGDEIRALENLPPMPDGQGQIYWMPVNMMPAGSVQVPVESEPEPKDAKALARIIASSAARGRLPEPEPQSQGGGNGDH